MTQRFSPLFPASLLTLLVILGVTERSPGAEIITPQLTLRPPSNSTIPELPQLPCIGDELLGTPAPPSSITPDLATGLPGVESSIPAAAENSQLPDFDLVESQLPWSTTTTVHLLADRELRQWIPFVSFAREIDSLEIAQRFGMGGGALFRLDPHASISAEMLYLEDHIAQNPMFAPETRAFLRFQFDF